MIEILKKRDLVSEMEKHISEEEDIFVECRPNKVPFVLKRLWQSALVFAALVILVVFYIVIRPFLGYILSNGIDFFLIPFCFVVLAFVGRELYKAIVDANNNYYVIATDGVHIIYFDKTLRYEYIPYKDIKSIILQKAPLLNIGDIYIKEYSDVVPKGFVEKFMQYKRGFIGIDESEKVYDVLKQIALQENENIFFSDSTENPLEIEHFREVKKFDKEITIEKDDSIIDRRNKRQ